MEVLELSLLDITVDGLESTQDVAEQIGPILLGHHLPEKGPWLGEIAVRVSRPVPPNQASDSELAGQGIRPHGEGPEGIGLVVGPATLIPVNPHGAVSLPVGDFGSVGAVNWDLFVIRSQSVSMRIGVGE